MSLRHTMVTTRSMTGAKKAQMQKRPASQQSINQILGGDSTAYKGPDRKYNKLLIAAAVLALIGGGVGIYFIVKGSSGSSGTDKPSSTTKPGTTQPTQPGPTPTNPPSNDTTQGTKKPGDKKEEGSSGLSAGAWVAIVLGSIAVIGGIVFVAVAPQAQGIRSFGRRSAGEASAVVETDLQNTKQVVVQEAATEAGEAKAGVRAFARRKYKDAKDAAKSRLGRKRSKSDRNLSKVGDEPRKRSGSYA